MTDARPVGDSPAGAGSPDEGNPGDASSARAPSNNQRQAWIDQARYVFLTLVVIGHLVGLVRSRSDIAAFISDFLYTFHIPGLVLLAGWGARRSEASLRGLSRIFWQLIVPYVIFQLIAFGLAYLLEGKQPSWTFTEQTFGLWFLVALAGWRLLAPWFRGAAGEWAVNLYLPWAAVAVGLLAGFSPAFSTTLSLSRIAYFLPIFMAGPWLVDRISLWRRDPRLRLLGMLVVLVGAAYVALMEPEFSRTIFFGRDSYAELGHDGLLGPAYRLAAWTFSTALAVGLMLAMPWSGNRSEAPSRLSSFVAEGGKHTMYPYLLHLPLLQVLAWSGLMKAGAGSSLTGLLITGAAVLGGILYTALCVTAPVRWLATPLVEPEKVYRAALSRAGRATPR